MATRTWLGSSNGDWYSVGQWSTAIGSNSYPLPGDAAFINSGTVDLLGSEEASSVPVDVLQISLGSSNKANPAALAATAATLGHTSTITSSATAAYATLSTFGPTGDAGTIIANASGGTFSIESIQPNASQAANFVLLHGGSIAVSGGDNLALDSLLTSDSGVTIATGSTLTNNGTDVLYGGITELQAGATLVGTGAFQANADARLQIFVPVPDTQTVIFGQAGRLDLGDVADFAGQISNFLIGNTIDLLNTIASFASYDATAGQLTIGNNGTQIGTLDLQGPASGVLSTATDGSGGTLITYPGSPSRTSLEITTGDQAMKSNLVRQTMTTSAGAPITGTGIKIGIMSDSFNATLNGVVHPADTAAQLGYLPATPGGTSAVTILQDSTITGVENEGLAMAELVHQVAPGAQLCFYTAEAGQDSFATGVNALVSAGANVIVDDWSFSNEPFYQIAGPVDTSIQNAISAGVNYFTSAANYGNAYYESTWQPIAADLVLQNGQPAQAVSAQRFTDGTAQQTITIPGGIGTSIDLQWDAAWPNLGSSVPDMLGMALYSMAGSLVATSHQVANGPDYGFIPEISLTAPTSAGTTQYQLAIYQIGTTAVSQFKYILFGKPGAGTDETTGSGATPMAQDPGGTINDPAAGQGSGSVHGHQLVPGANTVGAAYWATSPAYNVTPNWTEFFSSAGPGQLLFDQDGARLVTPEVPGKVDFVAPDGIQTSVPNFQLFFGTSAAAPDAAGVAALMLQANPDLTPAQVSSMLAASAVTMGLPAGAQGAGLVQAPGAVQLALDAAAACFAAGTRIRTERGDVPVEQLRIGDRVPTLLGNTPAPIVWIGHRHVDCRRHPRPRAIWPVRIRAAAFGPGRPCRDLFLSPDHAIFLVEVLIPVKHLVNGTSIAHVPCDSVTYYHVELPHHDVLLANGLMTESYLDTGDRGNFSNGGGSIALHPDFANQRREAAGCAPLMVTGQAVEAARRWLNLVAAQPIRRRAASALQR